MIGECGFPRSARCDRKHGDCPANQDSMKDHLGARLQPSAAEEGISITCEEQDLKDQQAGGPDRRRATKPGENEFADERLQQEQEKSATECRKTVKDHREHCARVIRASRDLRLPKVFQVFRVAG